MRSKTKKSALALMIAALVSGFAPKEIEMPSQWAAQNIVVPDGPQAGSKWDPDLTPQLPEILDCLSSEDPSNTVTV